MFRVYVCMAMMGGGSWAIWNCIDDGTTTTIKKLVIRIRYIAQHRKLVLHATRQTLLGLG